MQSSELPCQGTRTASWRSRSASSTRPMCRRCRRGPYRSRAAETRCRPATRRRCAGRRSRDPSAGFLLRRRTWSLHRRPWVREPALTIRSCGGVSARGAAARTRPGRPRPRRSGGGYTLGAFRTAAPRWETGDRTAGRWTARSNRDRDDPAGAGRRCAGRPPVEGDAGAGGRDGRAHLRAGRPARGHNHRSTATARTGSGPRCAGTSSPG